MLLRPYQRQAIDAAYAFLAKGPGNPLIVLPTGAGKSPVLTTMCKEAVEQWGGRVLVLTHVKELINQLYETINRVWASPLGKAPVGVYSAGLGMRQTNEPVTIGGIQSVYKRGTEIGRVDIILVDEAHLIPTDGDGMYQTLITTMRVINPAVRIIGLTATPYRLDSGWLAGPGRIFSEICYEASVRTLIDEQWLSMVRGKDGGAPDLSEVHKRGGEYIPEELEAAMTDDALVKHAVEEINKYGKDRKAWLIFCCGVSHAHMVAKALRESGEESCAVITGETPASDRDEWITAYKEKRLKCLVNVNVLTTGFDAPHVDLIIMLRPTLSPGLYSQMAGRGLRKADGKSNCMILDLAGNISRHGPIDNVRVKTKRPSDGDTDGEAPAKTCTKCAEILPLSALVCHACGFEFPKAIAKHEAKASDAQPLTVYKEEWYDVKEVIWNVHNKKGADASTPKTLRVSYSYGWRQLVSEFICVEHQGYARNKAIDWCRDHLPSDITIPMIAADLMDLIDRIDKEGRFKKPSRIKIREGGQWPEMIDKDYEDPEQQVDKDEPFPVSTPSYEPDDTTPF